MSDYGHILDVALPLESPYRVGEPACLYFWQLPVTKKYPLPKYYLGQIVLHVIKRPNGEILNPVEVIGLWWTGAEWEYLVELPPHHPSFKSEEEVVYLEEWQLEGM